MKNKVVKVPIEEALGLLLQENILAQRDGPLFDRVMMDDIAINLQKELKKYMQYKIFKKQKKHKKVITSKGMQYPDPI